MHAPGRRIEQWHADVQKAALSLQQREELQAAIQRRFEVVVNMDWNKIDMNPLISI